MNVNTILGFIKILVLFKYGNQTQRPQNSHPSTILATKSANSVKDLNYLLESVPFD